MWWCLFCCCAEEEMAELGGACCRKAAMKEDRKKGRCEDGIVKAGARCCGARGRWFAMLDRGRLDIAPYCVRGVRSCAQVYSLLVAWRRCEGRNGVGFGAGRRKRNVQILTSMDGGEPLGAATHTGRAEWIGKSRSE